MADFRIDAIFDTTDLKKGAKEVKKFNTSLQTGTKQTTRELKKTEKQAKKTAKSFSILAGVTAGLLILRKVNAFAKESIKLFNEQARVEKSLEVALGKVSTKLLDQASALQQLTLFGDEQTIQAQAFFAQMGIEEDQIARLIPLTQDFAAAKGVDLKTAADLVAKSVGSSTNALSRYGIVITGVAGSQDRVTSAVDALTEAFGGQSQAAALAGAGSLTQLSNTFGDLQEVIGGLILDGITPFIGGLKSVIKTVSDWLKVPAVENIKAQQTALNTLVIELSNSNTGEERRKQIIIELNKTYPKFLENLDTERITTANLTDRLREFNEAFFQKIVLQGNQDALQSEINEKASIELENLRLARDLQERLVRINERKNLGLVLTGKTLAEQVELINKANIAQSTQNGLFTEVDSLSLSLGATLARINRNKLEQIELDKEINLLTQERNLLLQNTNENGQLLLERGQQEEEQTIRLIELRKIDINLIKVSGVEAEKTAKNRAKGLALVTVATDSLAEKERLAQEEREERFAENTAMQIAGVESLADAGKAALGIIKREVVALIVKSILASAIPFPFNIAVAGGAGAIASGLFSQLGFKKGGFVPEYASGGFVSGFTGNAPESEVAGQVHGGEIVIPRSAVKSMMNGANFDQAISGSSGESGTLQNIEELLREDRTIIIKNELRAIDFIDLIEKGEKDKTAIRIE